MTARVYISGPISGMPDRNRRAFDQAELQLRQMGMEPVSPFSNGEDPNACWSEHMRADIALLVTCQAIVMLPGWIKSKGATLERNIADQLGIARILLPEGGE